MFLVFLKIKREKYLHDILFTSPFSLLFVSFTLVIRKTKYATFAVVNRKHEKTFRLAGIPTLTFVIPAQHSDQYYFSLHPAIQINERHIFIILIRNHSFAFRTSLRPRKAVLILKKYIEITFKVWIQQILAILRI